MNLGIGCDLCCLKDYVREVFGVSTASIYLIRNGTAGCFHDDKMSYWRAHHRNASQGYYLARPLGAGFRPCCVFAEHYAPRSSTAGVTALNRRQFHHPRAACTSALLEDMRQCISRCIGASGLLHGLSQCRGTLLIVRATLVRRCDRVRSARLEGCS